MTEYDYSPNAYEKYLETQSRIARWVDKTRRYAPSNPFIPATPAADCIPLYKDGDGSHRRQKSHSSKHSHRRIQSEESPPDRPRDSASRSECPRPMPPARWHTISDHRSGLLTRESTPPAFPPPARRSRPLRSNTGPAHVYNYPIHNNYSYAAYTLPNSAEADMSGHRSSKRHGLIHNTPNKETSASKASFLKRLLGGIISKSGNGKTETVKGRRQNSVRR